MSERPLAPPARRPLSVTGAEGLGAYRLLTLADPDGPAPRAGQFMMLSAVERWGGGADERPYLARAFSVARQREGELHFLLEDVGPGTQRLCELQSGERVWTLGPLGRPFSMPPRERRAILVGGGVGIAPLAILQDELGADRCAVLLGFRDGPRAQGAGLFAGEPQIATDDGACGHHGLVTELLAQKLARDPRAVVYACGPAAMLEAVRETCIRTGTPAQLALESGMACGFGACYGCAVPTRSGGYARVCVDGPVFDAQDLEQVQQHAGAPA